MTFGTLTSLTFTQKRANGEKKETRWKESLHQHSETIIRWHNFLCFLFLTFMLHWVRFSLLTAVKLSWNSQCTFILFSKNLRIIESFSHFLSILLFYIPSTRTVHVVLSSFMNYFSRFCNACFKICIDFFPSHFFFWFLHSYRKAHHIELFKCHCWCCWRYLHYTSIFIAFLFLKGRGYFCFVPIFFDDCCWHLSLCYLICLRLCLFQWVILITAIFLKQNVSVDLVLLKISLSSFIIDDYHFRWKRFQPTLLRIMRK